MKRRRSSLLVKIGIAVAVAEVVILAVIGGVYMAWLAQQGSGPAGETPAALLTQPGWRTMVVYGVVAGLLTFLLLSLTILYLINSMILGRLRLLNAVVQRVQSGDLTARVAGPFASDEIGGLQTGVNAMVACLSETVETLEHRVAERTRALEREALLRQTILEVGQAIASIRDFDTLLTAVTTLIGDRFGFYHVGIFLLDETGEYAVLRAASSDEGQRMLASHYRLAVGQESLVGEVAATQEPRISQGAGADAVYAQKSDLPDTRSEIGLPLSVGGQPLGVLDIHSSAEAAFAPEDTETLRGLADLAAVVLDNARLMTEAHQALAAQQRAYGEVTRQAWEELLRSQGRGYVSAADGVMAAPARWSAGMRQAKQEGRIVQEDPATLAVPVKSRDEQVLGVVRFRRAPETGVWNAQQVALVETLTDRLSQALESARLYEESRRLALQERLVGTVSARIRESLELESVLQVAARELAEAFGLADVVIRIGAADELLAQASQTIKDEA